MKTQQKVGLVLIIYGALSFLSGLLFSWLLGNIETLLFNPLYLLIPPGLDAETSNFLVLSISYFYPLLLMLLGFYIYKRGVNV